MDSPDRPSERSVRERALRLNRTARAWLDWADEAVAARSIAALVGADRAHVPVATHAVRFTGEGAETFSLSPTPVELRLTLPSTAVGWDLLDGVYRVELVTEGPARLQATTPEGAVIFRDRKTSGRAVLDLRTGRVRITSDRPITRVSVARIEGRAEGSVTVGPFRASGVVSARAVGHGTWTCEVAPDYDVFASVVGGRLEYWEGFPRTGPGGVEGGHYPGRFAPYGDPTGVGPAGAHPIPWSLAVQFDPTLPDPVFAPELPVGRVVSAADPVVYATDQRAPLSGDPADFWAGVGEWASPNEMDEPYFDATPGYWAYVWGTAAGADAAFDQATGAPVDPATAGAVPGRYLVRAVDPQSVVVTGTHAKWGEPVRVSNDPLLLAHNNSPYLSDAGDALVVPAGRYRRLSFERRPARLLVRATGAGTLRALDLRVRHNDRHPLGLPETASYREDLSRYADADAW